MKYYKVMARIYNRHKANVSIYEINANVKPKDFYVSMFEYSLIVDFFNTREKAEQYKEILLKSYK